MYLAYICPVSRLYLEQAEIINGRIAMAAVTTAG